jgi:hypothetical protein
MKEQTESEKEMKFRDTTRGLSLLLAAALLMACSDAEENTVADAKPMASKTSPLLAHIPDDTPYVLANSERLPDHLMDLMWKLGEPGMAIAERGLKDGMERLANKQTLSNEEKLLSAVFEELNGKMNRQGLAQLGIEPSGNLALYGIGVLPVVRTEIADSTALDATIARVEERAGTPFPRLNMGGVDYFEVGDKEGALIISTSGNQLMLAMLPQKAKAALLPQVLGIEKPARNIADSGRLSQINGEFGLTPYSTLLVDTTRLIDAILNDESEAAMEMFGEERSKLSQACRDEYRAMAEVAPRLVAGYTDITTTRIEQFGMLELRSDIAEGLNGITVSMPGLGQEEDGMFYLSMGLDIIKTKQFLQERIDGLRQTPYECENLSRTNTDLAKTEQQLNQPLPPFVGNMKGVRVKLTELDMESGMQPQAKGLLMVAMSNPQLVLGMGQAFVPQLAELQITPNGEPVALPADLIPADVEAPYLAMSDEGLALSIGVGEEAGLSAFLDADGPDGPVFASFGYTGDALAQYQRQAMSMLGNEGDELGSATAAASAYSNTLDRITATVSFTTKGVEMSSVSYLKR